MLLLSVVVVVALSEVVVAVVLFVVTVVPVIALSVVVMVEVEVVLLIHVKSHDMLFGKHSTIENLFYSILFYSILSPPPPPEVPERRARDIDVSRALGTFSLVLPFI